MLGVSLPLVGERFFYCSVWLRALLGSTGGWHLCCRSVPVEGDPLA